MSFATDTAEPHCPRLVRSSRGYLRRILPRRRDESEDGPALARFLLGRNRRRHASGWRRAEKSRQWCADAEIAALGCDRLSWLRRKAMSRNSCWPDRTI